jgi:hypothetical protein
LVPEQPAEAHAGAQFPELRVLAQGDADRGAKDASAEDRKSGYLLDCAASVVQDRR